MPILIVPSVVRYAIHGTFVDRPWVNIWDVALAGLPPTHSDIIATANVIADQYQSGLRPLCPSTWNCSGVKFMDLSSATGEVGEVVDTPAAYSMPFIGSGVGTAAPTNAAVLVTKSTTGGRSQRRGRCYLPGFMNANSNGPTITGSVVTQYSTFVNALLAAVNGATPGSEMVVVHNPAGGSPGATAVSGLSVASRLSTQRRRLRA